MRRLPHLRHRNDPGTDETECEGPNTTERPDLAQSLAYWLIIKEHNGWIEVLTTDIREERLPVFSFEEAVMFLRLEKLSEKVWSTRATTVRELDSCKSIG